MVTCMTKVEAGLGTYMKGVTRTENIDQAIRVDNMQSNQALIPKISRHMIKMKWSSNQRNQLELLIK